MSSMCSDIFAWIKVMSPYSIFDLPVILWYSGMIYDEMR